MWASGTISPIHNVGTVGFNPSVVSGLSYLAGFAVSGNDIFVANINAPDGGEISTIGEYTTSGATVTPRSYSGFRNPGNVATDGTYLYVASWTGLLVPALAKVPGKYR